MQGAEMTLTRTMSAPPTPATASRSTASPAAAAPEAGRRDTTIDAVRAVCLLVVVVLHALMVGVESTPDGGLRTSVALSGQGWFAPVTWALQVMPLFFIAGGFASLSQWRRMRARGASASEYVVGRVRRLAVPSAAMILVVGGVLSSAAMLGGDPSLLAEAGLRIGQPLWFLAVYLGATALVPAMSWLHERRPLLTLGALAAGVVLVDLVRLHGESAAGYLNLVFVWLLMQQLGFALLDRSCGAWSRRTLLAGVAIPLVVLVVLVACGWSPDMIDNLNPPTAAIALLGATQFFLLHLLRPRLDRVMRNGAASKAAARAGAHAMTVYLWHMPVILLLVALVWGAGLPLPAPHTGAGWASRIPWLIAVAACVIPAAIVFARGEKRLMRLTGETPARQGAGVAPAGVPSAGSHGRRAGLLRGAVAALCVVLAIAGVVTALLTGMVPPGSFLLAVALLSGSVALGEALRRGSLRNRARIETRAGGPGLRASSRPVDGVRVLWAHG
jgi:peptidoglycan/LPS O-acetylase OafA/YrhL